MNMLQIVLYSDKNVNMVKDICLDRLRKAMDPRAFNSMMFNFDKIFKMVMGTIIQEETENFSAFPIKTSVLKINNIIIKEAYNYISNMETEDSTMSTVLEDIQEDIPERQEYIQELKREIEDKPDVREVKPLVPVFSEELYEVGSDNMTKEGEIYTSDIYIPNVKTIEILQIRIDKSDYMITEYCNTFKINDVMLRVEPGNYSENELETTIQERIDSELNSKQEFSERTIIVDFQKINDTFILYHRDILSESSSINVDVDFSIENSIAGIIGFEKKKYQLKNEKLHGKKHNLSHSSLVMFDIEFIDEVKAQAIVPLNVKYNETKYYDLEYKKLYTSSEPIFTISNIKVKLNNERGEPYNTRDRNFYIRFKVIYLEN